MKKYAVMYEPGDIINLAGTKFVVLDVERRGNLPDSLFVLSCDTVGESVFGRNNNYAISDLRSEVDKWLEEMGKKGLNLDRIIPRNIDLTTLDGCIEYNTMKVKAAPLTLDEARKYAYKIPRVYRWYWLATGWSGHTEGGKNNSLGIGSNNEWQFGHCTDSHGIRPAMKVSASILDESEDAGLGYVTIEDMLNEIYRRVYLKEES